MQYFYPFPKSFLGLCFQSLVGSALSYKIRQSSNIFWEKNRIMEKFFVAFVTEDLCFPLNVPRTFFEYRSPL
jgi:hypothetical protein